MNLPITEHVPPDDVTGYTVVVHEPKDGWNQQENGKPGFVEWAIYGIVGREVNAAGPRLYWKKGDTSSLPGTTELDEAETEATGFVKWDGCSEWDGGTHVCGADDLEHFLEALRRAYSISLEAVGGGLA